MKTNSKTTASQTLAIARSLAALPRERAPRSLLPAVLTRVGLGDTYWRIETPIGGIFIAHSRAGISMVSRARSARDFERAFESRTGRPIQADARRVPVISGPTTNRQALLGIYCAVVLGTPYKRLQNTLL